jgi:PAS domain S-box-containing protein
VHSILTRQGEQAKVYTEYMGMKWTADPDYFNQLSKVYNLKFSDIFFDVIIATDNDAFNFLLAYSDEVFGRVPTVFCGVNYFQPEALSGHDLYTGVNETVDFKANIDLLLRLHPATKQILVIVDTSVTGQQVFREISAVTPLYEQRVAFDFLSDISMEDLLERVSSLPSDTLVLYTFFFRDKNSRVFEYDESAALISDASKVPMYGAWDFSLGHGIIGGKLTSGFEQGKMAAELAARIIHGAQPKNIPLVMQSPSQYMFDYNQMQRFGIMLKDLPDGSTVINQPSSSYTISKNVVWALSAGVFLFAGFSVMLLANIRQREQARRQLKESEQQYHSLVDNLNVGVYRNTGGLLGTFLQANPAMLKLFGFDSLDEFLQTPVSDLYQDSADRVAYVNEMERIGSVADRELKMKKKDGTPIWVSCSAQAVYEENQAIKWIDGVFEDITEKKLLEEQLRQSQKLEALGTLAGGIAHDFNNILTAISGYGTMLKGKVAHDPALVHYVNPILSAAEKAARLTQGLLVFSRKQVINPKPINLNEVVDGMERLLLRLIGEDMELRKHQHDKELIVMADHNQVDQTLLNLVTNARDAMPEGGLITIATERVMIRGKEMLLRYDLKKTGEYAVLSVSDTGSGMDEATQNRIFEPFFSTKEVGKGTGLGLSIVHGIVKQHNGNISVDSEPGKGTTFKIYLPLIEGAVEDAGPIAPLSAIGGTETILLGEDDECVRQWITDVLSQAGYTVIIAVDGQELVAQFSSSDHINLVLLDVVMPKKNGREAMEEIKRIQPEVKALFMSGYTADIIHSKGILDQRINFLSKPLTRETLLHKIREVLAQ